MSEPVENTREMSKSSSFFVGCAIGLCLLLAVGVFVVVRAKRIEDERRALTLKRLDSLANNFREGLKTLNAPRADGTGDDWTGMKHLHEWEAELDWIPRHVVIYPAPAPHSEDDGWGHPIRYRCPGPVHKHGWDFYSCGPNGKDDEGTFDDIIVGEDVAAIASR